VTCNAGESFVVDHLLESVGVLGLAHEDNDLVEINAVEEFNELLYLLRVFKLDVVLLEAMKGELSIAVNVELEWLLHVEPADVLDFGTHGG
jgi:hypothetical protein